MLGKHGPRGPDTVESLNSTIEKEITRCVSSALKEQYPNYETHSTITSAPPLSALVTRIISVRLGRPDLAYSIIYDTKTKEHTVRKPAPNSKDLSEDVIKSVLGCITATNDYYSSLKRQVAGKQRRYKTKSVKRTKRSKTRRA